LLIKFAKVTLSKGKIAEEDAGRGRWALMAVGRAGLLRSNGGLSGWKARSNCADKKMRTWGGTRGTK